MNKVTLLNHNLPFTRKGCLLIYIYGVKVYSVEWPRTLDCFSENVLLESYRLWLSIVVDMNLRILRVLADEPRNKCYAFIG